MSNISRDDYYNGYIVYQGNNVSLYRRPSWKRYEFFLHTKDKLSDELRITDMVIEDLTSGRKPITELIEDILTTVDRGIDALYNQNTNKE